MKKGTKLIALVLCILMCGSVCIFAFMPNGGNGGKFDYSIDLNDDGTYKDIDVTKCVTVPDYKNVEYTEEDIVVTDDEVQQKIDSYLNSFSETNKIKNRDIVAGDLVSVNCVATVDGKKYEDYMTGMDKVFTAAEVNMNNKLESGLIGHKAGYNFEFTNTIVSEDEEINDKEATYKVTINYIKEVIVPELTLEFVNEKLAGDEKYETIEAFREKLKKNMGDEKINNFVHTYVVKNATATDIPDTVVNHYLDNIVGETKYAAEINGISFGNQLQMNYYVDNEDMFRTIYFTNFKEQTVKYYMVVQAIAEENGITVTDDNITKYFSDNNIGTPEDILTYYGKGYCAQHVMGDKIVNLIMSFAKESVELTKEEIIN